MKRAHAGIDHAGFTRALKQETKIWQAINGHANIARLIGVFEANRGNRVEAGGANIGIADFMVVSEHGGKTLEEHCGLGNWKEVGFMVVSELGGKTLEHGGKTLGGDSEIGERSASRVCEDCPKVGGCPRVEYARIVRYCIMSETLVPRVGCEDCPSPSRFIVGNLEKIVGSKSKISKES